MLQIIVLLYLLSACYTFIININEWVGGIVGGIVIVVIE